MGPLLSDDIWMRRGISILWDAEALATVCTPSQVVSLRQFLLLYTAGWPEGELSLVNDARLVVAGLESAIDALSPDEAVNWLERTVYPAIISFQENVAGGGTDQLDGKARPVAGRKAHRRPFDRLRDRVRVIGHGECLGRGQNAQWRKLGN